MSHYEIVSREDFSDVTYLLEIHHPMMARAAKPGQFVIVMLNEQGERIPLTIADFDREKGTITLVIQAVGKTTRQMQHECQVGTSLYALVGPMGVPSPISHARKVLCVGGGLAVATYCDLRLCTAASRFGYPIARTLGNALSRPLLERCVHVFGEPLSREMLLASRMVDAHRAYGVGAVMHVAATATELEREVQAVVEGLLQAAPLTLQTTKQQLREITAGTGDPEHDERLLELVYSSPGFREGVRAFLAKEPPHFT
jgi:hypothetical protein